MSCTRLLITISGAVQGVGFRPFVYRLARRHGLAGHIRNTGTGVDLDVQGNSAALSRFQEDLVAERPERAVIAEIRAVEAPLGEASDFEIAHSERGADTALALLPDSAMCSECLAELWDPGNRRYGYPFLHCMTCGPRFSLFFRMPFDRGNTSMIDFSMCGACQAEYANPADRRFYSQTNCCPQCGPELKLLDPRQKELAGASGALDAAAVFLREGNIVAMKNTGGFLLLADATNAEAVNKLRLAKKRAKKPFAVLMPDAASARQAAFIHQAAECVLTSPAAPIVLVKKRQGEGGLVESIACESPYQGIMLPHNPMQHLLLRLLNRPLAATSGNISGMPLCITNEEAFAQLSSVADAFLVHNRRIMRRADDSIVQIVDGRPMVLRRARGYIPYAVSLPNDFQGSACLLGSGGHQKNSFAFAKDHRLYVSQHMGDLDSVEASLAYDREVKEWEALLNIEPIAGVGDMHPGYYTSHYLEKRKMTSGTIQHHRAHVYSGMLDNQLLPPLLSFAWDGTGFGDDQTIWGGETFVVTKDGIKRFASLHPFRLPGGEIAVREPRRSALGVLHALFGKNMPPHFQAWAAKAFQERELNVLAAALEKGVNAPVCSSIGRLFDAVSALLDGCLISDFEGHASMVLESLAAKSNKDASRYTLPLIKEKDLWLLDWRSMVGQIFDDKTQGAALEDIALGFHLALVQAMEAVACKASIENVLLTGGVMQNSLLLEKAIFQLREGGFYPFWHRNIPPNDGGLAAGQIIGKLYE